MSQYDAKSTKYTLERALESAKPLKDKDLNKHIETAIKHVETKLDPKGS